MRKVYEKEAEEKQEEFSREVDKIAYTIKDSFPTIYVVTRYIRDVFNSFKRKAKKD